MIKVLVNGASGAMGKVTVAAVGTAADMELVGACRSTDNLSKQLDLHQPDVVIDFTTPGAVFDNVLCMIEHRVHPVIGTTGFTQPQLDEIGKRCAEERLGGIYAPNFSLGAALMTKYAVDASRYFDHAEIIEMHHEKKIDAPSGTAKHTRSCMIKEASSVVKNDVPIHSVRLPGLFAHQLVIFGAPGETLTLRHDALDRQCMMPGVLLACRVVRQYEHFVVGLEHIIA